MAKFIVELPKEIYDDFNLLYNDCPKLFEDMTRAGAEVVYKKILQNMKNSFKDTTELKKHLKITKSYRTLLGKYVNTKVAFYGYYRKNDKDYINRKNAAEGHLYKTGYKGNTIKMSSGRKAAEYIQKGVPVPLIIAAREFGTSSGENKKPFVRKAFNAKAEIEKAMLDVQNNYRDGMLRG